jgi:hypothetical protein
VVAAKDDLEVFGVDVVVAAFGLEVEPGLVGELAEDGAVADGDELLVDDVHLAVDVEVALQDADEDQRVADVVDVQRACRVGDRRVRRDVVEDRQQAAAGAGVEHEVGHRRDVDVREDAVAGGQRLRAGG